MHATNPATSAIEPLAPDAWFARIEKVLERVRNLGDDCPEPILRHTFHLVQLAPPPFRHFLDLDIGEADYEMMLEDADYSGAALALIASGVDCQIARAGRARVISVTLTLGREGPQGSGRSIRFVDAFLEAFCLAVIAARTSSASDEGAISRLRLPADAGLHPSSSTH